MGYDEVVVGSGLSALGAVMGMNPAAKVLVIGGPVQPEPQYYDSSRTIPCANLAMGGLGNYWHGVIPSRVDPRMPADHAAAFINFFERFYPRASIEQYFGQPRLFVPWRPIRPADHWPRLERERAGKLTIRPGVVIELRDQGGTIHVRTQDGASIATSRVWLCAGPLHTPRLLHSLSGTRLSRGSVSDHVISYLGQIDRRLHRQISPPRPRLTPDGVWFEGYYEDSGRALLTMKPARFAFAKLDQGIEQRAVFGLPTAGAVAKILRAASPGLIAEALYNRAGLFPGAAVQSIYAQIIVPDAYSVNEAGGLEPRRELIADALEVVRRHIPWPQINWSRRPEVFIRAIHLHHSLEPEALAAAGLNTHSSRVQVADASVLPDIGPDHHSFRLMLAASLHAAARTNR